MKKPFIYILTAGLAVSMIANTNTVNAVESNATVEFTPPTDSVAPVDPTNPANPFPGNIEEDGVVPEGEEAQGPLSLDYVTHINFDQHDIETNEQTYQSITSSPFVQVTDRRGTGEGWNVTASATYFNSDNVDTLLGAEIIFENGTTISTSETPSPGINDSISLMTGGDPVTVSSATARAEGEALNTAEGLGTWVMRWLSNNEENENVSLYIPESSASPGTHTATINWTLESGPSADDSDFDVVEE